jgi:hypothetical protein
MAVGNLSGGEKQDGCCLYTVLAYTSGYCLEGRFFWLILVLAYTSGCCLDGRFLAYTCWLLAIC